MSAQSIKIEPSWKKVLGAEFDKVNVVIVGQDPIITSLSAMSI